MVPLEFKLTFFHETSGTVSPGVEAESERSSGLKLDDHKPNWVHYKTCGRSVKMDGLQK